MPLSKFTILCLESSLFLREDMLSIKSEEQDVNNDRYLMGEFRNLYEDYRRQPDKFYEYTRVNVNTFDYILQHLHMHLIQQLKSKRIVTITEKLFLTLRYIGHGIPFMALSLSYRIDRSTVAKIIYQTLNGIWITLKHVHMPQPTQKAFKKKTDEFMMKCQFPNCIGAIGTKNIRIMKYTPTDSTDSNKDSQKFCTLVLQAITDADYKFTAIEIGIKERAKDGRPFHFHTSRFNKLLESKQFNVPPCQELPDNNIRLPHVLVGNEEYPLKTYLMRPYPLMKPDRKKEIFNERLLRARRTIDFTFGVLTNKWRILLKTIETNTKHAALIIKVTCLLHNIVRDQDGNYDRDYEEYCNILSNDDSQEVKKSNRNGRSTSEAMAIREKFKCYFVNNPIETSQLSTSR